MPRLESETGYKPASFAFSNARMTPEPLQGNEFTLNLSDRMVAAINGLMEKTGNSPEQLILKALALFKAAAEAHEEGKSVGVAATPDVLETVFTDY